MAEDEAKSGPPLVVWVLGAPIVVQAAVLALSRRPWTTMIESHNRSGRSSLQSDGSVHAWLAVGALVVYFLATAWEGGLSFGWNPGLRTSAGDVFVVKTLARGLAVALLYYGAYTLLRDYVLH